MSNDGTGYLNTGFGSDPWRSSAQNTPIFHRDAGVASEAKHSGKHYHMTGCHVKGRTARPPFRLYCRSGGRLIRLQRIKSVHGPSNVWILAGQFKNISIKRESHSLTQEIDFLSPSFLVIDSSRSLLVS